MITYSFDPTGLNLKRLGAQARRAGGNITLVTTTAEGLPATATVFVSVPEGVPAATVQNWVDTSLNVPESALTAREQLDALIFSSPAVIAALALRAGSGWAGYSANKKTAIINVIDEFVSNLPPFNT